MTDPAIPIVPPALGVAAARWATRAVFFASGFFMSAWAPLVPLAKSRLGLGDGHLGLLLLCSGVGLLATMPAAGLLTGRLGCRRLVPASGAVAACTVPLLATVNHPWLLATGLVLFGAMSGLMDVSMNVHAVLVERASGRPLMSGFHGLWSVGGVVGSTAVTLMLAAGLSPPVAAGVVAVLSLGLLLVGRPFLLAEGGGTGGPAFAVPRGVVLLLGGCCFVLFLAEGSVLDWSGVFLTTARGVAQTHAGLGYVAFAAAMTACRLAGDAVVRVLGPFRTVLFGCWCAAGGFLVVVLVPSPAVDLVGYFLVGVGAANVVPVMFSAAGRQTAMPTNLAIPAMTTVGYAGNLAGPALVGLLASVVGLPVALATIAAMLLLVGVASSRVRL